MKSLSIVCFVFGTFNCLVQGIYGEWLTLTNDGPSVKGGRIVFRADVFDYDGTRPHGSSYIFKWRDDGLSPHKYKTESTKNTTSYYEVDYPADEFPVGIYTMEVILDKYSWFMWNEETSRRVNFEITTLMNGNMSVIQNNNTLKSNNIASGVKTKFQIDLRKGDDYYVKNNLGDTSTYWFVDCKYYGVSKNFSLDYKFPKAGDKHTIEALIIGSHEPPTTTTVAPTTTTTPMTTSTTPTTTSTTPTTTTTNSTPVTLPSNDNNTSANLTKPTAAPGTTEITTASTTIPTTIPTIAPTANPADFNPVIGEIPPAISNLPFAFACSSNSTIPPDPKKTYGYFRRQLVVKEPIGNITVEGTNWIQPWQTLALNVTCPGSGPFRHCLRVIQGQYNVTGNETCTSPIELATCNFTIRHYFLESGVATVLVVLSNDVSNHVFPITITVYKAIKKPQLSVIVVPVSCSLAAIVLIIFGVAYYMQSRARFTVEVADFDFGQINPEMEYKTFTERLRDSFNNSVRPAGYRINESRRSYYGSMNDHRIPIADYKMRE